MLTTKPDGSLIDRRGALVGDGRFVGTRVTRRQLKQHCKAASVIAHAAAMAIVAIGVVQVKVRKRSAVENVTLAMQVLMGAV